MMNKQAGRRNAPYALSGVLLAANLVAGTAAAGTLYYVNDGSTKGDVYTTAVGAPANDGLTPGTPLDSIAAVLSAHNLGGGDTLYIDTGVYNLENHVTITNNVRGASWESMATFQGSTNAVAGGTVLNRTGSGAGRYIFYLPGNMQYAEYIAFRDMTLQNASAAFALNHPNNIDGYNRNNRLERLILADNDYGIGSLWSHGDAGGTWEIVNCLFARNKAAAIQWYPLLSVLVANHITVYQTNLNSYAFDVRNATRTVCVSNSVVIISGAVAAYTAVSRPKGDYNVYYFTNGAVFHQEYQALSSWQRWIGEERHSLAGEDPLLSADWHPLSAEGRWNGSGWSQDGATSPAIDMGNPAAACSAEPAPNGGRANAGFFGNTGEASKTPAGRYLQVLSLNNGGVYGGSGNLYWNDRDVGGDTVTISVSTNNGATWASIASGVSATAGSVAWDSTAYGTVNLPVCRWRVVCDQDGAVLSTNRTGFRLGNGGLRYYVNDGSTASDVYTTAAGLSSNDGLTPGTPLDSIAAVLAKYKFCLGPDDTVYVDTGLYNVTADIVINRGVVGGSWSHMVTFQGSSVPGGTVLNRNGSGSIFYFDGNLVSPDNAYGPYVQYIAIRDMTLRNATYAIAFRHPTNLDQLNRNNRFERLILSNNGYGIGYTENLQDVGTGHQVVNCLFATNSAAAIRWPQQRSLTVNQCTLYHGAGSHVFELPNAPVQLSVTNSIVFLDGSGKNVYQQSSGVTGDYNDYFLTNSAGIHASYPTLANWQAVTDPSSISADPLFKNARSGDFGLASGSPCIDRGTNQAWLAGATDLAGNPRLKSGRVDIGAYESIPPQGTALLLR